VEDESIDANHCVECAFTGRFVTEVFQTLSAGKAGQSVPGNKVATTRASREGARVVAVAESTATTEPNTHPATARPLRALCTRRRRSGMFAE
jgi:hypothetical protein